MSYLILGGCGFIGRNLLAHLLEDDLATHVTIVDKALPAMAWLNNKHRALFEDERVTFKSINLASPANIAKLSDVGRKFDYCINLASETKQGLTKEIYEERVTKVAVNCAQFAADHGVKLFVEISTAHVYGPNGVRSKEDAKTHPKYDLDCSKLKAEEGISKIAGLNYVILRCGVVYGPGDRGGYVTSQLVIAAIYSHLKETMRLIWSKDMFINTVHVEDVCRAISHLVALHDLPKGQVYNLVDEGDTTIDTICRHVTGIFSIKHEYLSTLLSMIAAMSLKDMAEEVNEKHMKPWSDMCTKDGILNTPLSPFIYSSQLDNLNVRASADKLSKTGFTLNRPSVTQDSLREVLRDCIDLEMFPKCHQS